MTATGGGSPTRSAGSRAHELPVVPGVVETIANGLSLALVYPFLVFVPLIVDALAWSGLRLSAGELGTGSASIASVLDETGLREDLLRLVGLFVPSLLTWVDRDELFVLGDGLTVVPGSSLVAVVALAGILVLGALAHATFRVPVAYVVRQRPLGVGPVSRSIVMAWLRLMALAVFAVAVFALVALPLAVAGALFYLIGVNAAPLIGAAVALPALLAAVYFYFAPDAIAVSEVGPLRACYLSFNVVRRNFWPVVGLIASIVLISTGLPVLWLSRVDHPIGLLIGVFCNALVSTGLVIASMQFYSDRLGRWQQSQTGPGPRPARS